MPVASTPAWAVLRPAITAKRSRRPGDLALSNLAREILAHLRKHPQAGDTLIGIARWWLLRERIAAVTTNVKCALDELVELGFVARIAGADGQASYRLHGKRRRPGA